MEQMGHGQGYEHAHDDPNGVADMDCLPDGLHRQEFYRPVDRGRERNIREYLAWVRQKRLEKRSKNS